MTSSGDASTGTCLSSLEVLYSKSLIVLFSVLSVSNLFNTCCCLVGVTTQAEVGSFFLCAKVKGFRSFREQQHLLQRRMPGVLAYSIQKQPGMDFQLHGGAFRLMLMMLNVTCVAWPVVCSSVHTREPHLEGQTPLLSAQSASRKLALLFGMFEKKLALFFGTFDIPSSTGGAMSQVWKTSFDRYVGGMGSCA